MAKYTNIIVTGIITFILSLALTSTAAYFSGNNGDIRISRPFMVNNINSVAVSINNYSSKFIDGLSLEVPQGVSSKDFYSDIAVQVVDSISGNDQGKRAVKINQISPRRTTTIIISGVKSNLGDSVRALNALESGLNVDSDDELVSPVFRWLRAGLVLSVVQTIFVSIALYFVNRSFDGVKERIKEAREEMDKARANSDDLKKELRETKAYSVKMRILLLGKISDYSKELDFWRNLIKEITLLGGVKRGEDDKIQSLVTKTLKTFGATRRMPELEQIKIAAAWLRDEERKLDRD